jgi:hypothetical protein
MLTQGAALGLTLAIESPIVWLAAWWLRVHWLRAVVAGLLASSLTHPGAWWLSRQLGPLDYGTSTLAIEALVCLVEAVVLKLVLQVAWRRALVLSVVANAASAGAGLLLWH